MVKDAMKPRVTNLALEIVVSGEQQPSRDGRGDGRDAAEDRLGLWGTSISESFTHIKPGGRKQRKKKAGKMPSASPV